MLIFSISIFAAIITASADNSNWNNTGTWTPAQVPVAGDDVTIPAGITVIVSDAQGCTSLILGSGNGIARLTFSGSGELTVSGSVSVGIYSGKEAGIITFSNGSTLIANSLTLVETKTNDSEIIMTDGGTLKTELLSVTEEPSGGKATWIPGTGTVELTATNTLPTTIFTTFYNLTINGGTTALGTDITVDGAAALTLTSGNVTTGSNTLTLGTSTSSLGTLSRTSGTIIGNFKRWFAAATISNVLFPIGTASNYRPANISFPTTAPTTGGTLTAFFTASDPGTTGLSLDDGGTSIVNAGIDGYWTITADDGFAGGTYNLDLTADGFSGVSDYTTLRLIKRPTSGSWTVQGTHSAGTGSNGTPVVHRTGMTDFTGPAEYGVGGASDNPLPVELTSFTANVKGSNVVLNWRTETEVNNYGFEVERKNPPLNPPAENAGQALQGGDFEKIGFVEGHGNSNSPKEYEFIDDLSSLAEYSPIDSLEYRLKQIDTDGTFEYYSPTVKVDLRNITDIDDDVLPATFELSQNYPNPFSAKGGSASGGNPGTIIGYKIPNSLLHSKGQNTSLF